MNFLPGDR